METDFLLKRVPHKLKSGSLHLINLLALNDYAKKILPIRDERHFVRVNFHVGIKSEIRIIHDANVPQILSGRILP